MKKIRCIIIEDEPLAAKVLKEYIQQVPQLELTGVFREALSADTYLQNEKTDLLFLDIHLPRIKGISFLRTLNNPPAVIITTAYHQYALEGFELSVTDYLMKPFSFQRFNSSVQKAIQSIEAGRALAQLDSTPKKSLFLTINRKKVKIVLDDILYIESSREYVKIFTVNGEFISKISTAELETLLPEPMFKRIHRSFIIAMDKIDSYTKEQVEIRGRAIVIGKSFRKDFQQVIKG